jgi:hypothetical protein
MSEKMLHTYYYAKPESMTGQYTDHPFSYSVWLQIPQAETSVRDLCFIVQLSRKTQTDTKKRHNNFQLLDYTIYLQ